MNLRRLATKNVWQNRGRYLAYLASAAFSVMIYFLYTALAHHPYFQGGYRGAEYAVDAIEAASVVIAVFTLLFLLYSGAAFIRSRMKEFGLFTLLGLTRRQLIRMILWENLVVAAVALALGLALGLLFLKLFFMAISLVLRLPEELPMVVSWTVLRQTVAVFGSFFLVVSLLSLRGVLRRNIIELIRAGRQPKSNPTFSLWKALLGLILVVGGYVWASVPTPEIVALGVLPVTGMVSAGTFLLMREGSIALLSWLHRRDRYFHRTRPFLTISQLTFKMQDNYRVLSAVTLLVAVILSAVGTIFSMYIVTGEDAALRDPQAIQLVVPKGSDIAGEITLVQETLDRHGVTDLQQVTGTLLRGTLDDTLVNVLPYSLYAQLYRPHGKLQPLDGEKDAIQVHRYILPLGAEAEASKSQATLRIASADITLDVLPDYSGRLLNGYTVAYDSLIVADATFERLVADHPDAAMLTFAAWAGKGWNSKGVRAAAVDLRERYPAGSHGVEFTTTLDPYYAAMGDSGTILFLAVFVSLVFFAASCSLLYFRLFTEIDEDRRYYSRLQQLGVSGRELRRLARGPASVIFFVPFVIGLLHSTFAMQALGTFLNRTVLHFGWMIACAYLLLYAVYFAVTYALYWRSLRLERFESAAL